MELILLFISFGILAVIFGLFAMWRALSKFKGSDRGMEAVMLQNQIAELTRALDTKLSESTRASQFQFTESAKITREVTEKLVKLEEANRQVAGFAESLKGLQDILKNPKQRGVLGEYYLETVLKNVLPPGSYQTQYEFKDGSKVDAVVFVKEKIIPIDSKFSLENYNRMLEATDPAERARIEDAFKADLKNRIDETSKYIKPEEGTMEFAFMFIPSEAIYYDVLVNKIGSMKSNTRDMIEYATKDKKVIIVSPTSFLAYLQTVLQGLKAMQIEESAKEIRQRVEELGRHLKSYETYMQKLGSHLGTSVGMYNSAYKELGKIDKDVLRITGEGAGFEPRTLEKPAESEDTD